ncbi:NAD-dependent epimerase/dehydratase family protein [Kitasatospora sp. NPDC090091]|uniref:NAD-dependent epimerase/dehydratase family protein n=1 Tax=Kitasatospora sp. NPDC090091 TaxID=3364081 RepID=UPI003816DE37
MQIVGRGFLAQSLRPLVARHPDTVVFAAGVSSGTSQADAGFAREADLLYDALVGCRRSGRRLVYFSTSSAGLYGVQRRPCREDGPVRPSSPYGRHKLAMEEVIRGSGTEHVILRLAYPVGRAQRPHQFLPSLVRQVRLGRVRVHRGARRDLIDVGHAVALIDALLGVGAPAGSPGAGAPAGVVNLASGWSVPVEDIVGHIEGRLGVRAERQVVEVPPEDPVCTERLRRLVPAAAGLGFGPHYYRRVIDACLARTRLPEEPRDDRTP